MSDTDLVDAVDGLLHAETQVHDGGVDLTVADVSVVEEPGRVDFGGDELDAARTEPHGTYTRRPDDDYEWWLLDSGTYLIEYNESLSTDRPLRLETREAVLERGATHPTRVVTSLPRMPLSVSEGGLHLKENARVSTLRPHSAQSGR
ncbi:dCTP deaminase [Haloplanus halophilus]|uniref:dCTP deaminase n=1 Tax=Haloplanus halophilus TaxID=2949993 RepID=UPI00203F8B7A|nr:dCTP deaminase [Haloplanus sp. GDY1]